MKRFGVILGLCICLSFLAACSENETKENQAEKQDEVLNLCDEKLQADEYSFNNALSKGYVIRKTTFNENVEKNEIYNKNSLDEFIDSIKKGESKEIVIVEYLDENDVLTINKLCKLEYDGEKITGDYYDVFTNKEEFKLEDTADYKSVNVKEIGEDIKYFFTDDNHDEIKLMSFNKNEINNSK